jgi:hypothetical protein
VRRPTDERISPWPCKSCTFAESARRVVGINITVEMKAALQESKRKEKAGLNLQTGLWNLSRRRPTFPRSYPRSIIGPARLNFRVRDGNGCDPRGMTTGKVQKFEVRDSRLAEKTGTRTSIFKIFCRDLIAADNSSEGEGKERFFEPLPSLTSDFFAGNYKFGPAVEQNCESQGCL